MHQTLKITAMKTFIILLAITAMGLSASAQNSRSIFVTTSSATIACQTIHVGVFKTRCTLPNGQKIKIDNNTILQYSDGVKLMQRMPVYRGNNKTNRTDFMELVQYRNGLSVYKYEYFSGTCDCTNAVFTYYKNNECINVRVNPTIAQLNRDIDTYSPVISESQTADRQPGR